MPTFRYETLSPTEGGAAQAALIEAADRAEAVRTLRRRGITPLRVEPVGNGAAAAMRAAPADAADPAAGVHAEPTRRVGVRAALSRAEMAAFMAELATAVSAGLTLVQAMRTLMRAGRTQRQKDMLAFLIHELEHGRSLADAAAAWGRPFGELTVNLIRAGEASGRLAEVLEQAALLLDRDLKLRRAILGATIYPMILAVLVAVAVTVVVTVIVPRVLEPLKGQVTVADLPLPTRIVSGVADFMGAYWWLVIGMIIAAATTWPRMYRQPATRLAVDGALIRLPVLGQLLRDVAVARFTRTLGTLISAGLPALTALRTTKGTLGNKAMESLIDEVCERVASGGTISQPLEEAGGGGVFPPLLVQIVGVGERSGRLPELLGQAAEAMESRTEASIKLFTTVLPPMLVVVLAGIVGFVVAAILLPLLEMQEYIT
jgi:type II secretory pathway component PulF